MFGFGSGLGTIGKNAANTAVDTGAGFGAQAGGISANLLPFLNRQLNNPEGFTQQQQGAMLGAAEGGSGGSTAGLTTEANLASARDRNSGGFSGALDQAARTAGKTNAGISEGIAAKNATLQQDQQQEAAKGLSGMYGMDTSAQLKAMGLIPEDIKATSEANLGPWQALTNFMTGEGKNAMTAGAMGG